MLDYFGLLGQLSNFDMLFEKNSTEARLDPNILVSNSPQSSLEEMFPTLLLSPEAIYIPFSSRRDGFGKILVEDERTFISHRVCADSLLEIL